ncbi:MAG TPA: hypothetical protein VHP14_24265 [Anaerolineales bacterium]|nr:hypothetical protein [Anaerolineales bacterium]
MIDPIKILRRAWYILWNYRTLWIFGLVLALAAGSSTGNGSSNNSSRWQQNNNPSYQGPSYTSPQDFFNDVGRQWNNLLSQGIPDLDITGKAFVTFLWIVGGFILFMFLIGIVVAIARYVSEVAVIRMVDEYENSGTKMTVREGFRIGWSRSAWRLFLINLIVNLPVIILMLTLLVTGVLIFIAVINNNFTFNPANIVAMSGLAFLVIFIVIILSIFLGLLRYFFWRVAALEDAGVGESLRRGFALARENWKSVGIMWLVMIGLGIAWAIVSVIAVILTIPVVILTAVVAAIVSAVPGLLLLGIFSIFLSGPLPWIAAGIFILPLFFTIAFSPWLLLGSWQQVFTSTVWTLTYRELKVLPAALIPPTDLEPVGD